MKRNPFEIVKWFEEEIAEYTGAKYAIATDNCTDAIFLCCKYLNIEGKDVTIPQELIFQFHNLYFKQVVN